VLFFFFSFVLGFVLVGVFSLFFSGGSSGLGLTRRRWWDSVGRRMEFPSLLVFISLLARDFGLGLHLRIVDGSDSAFVAGGTDCERQVEELMFAMDVGGGVVDAC